MKAQALMTKMRIFSVTIDYAWKTKIYRCAQYLQKWLGLPCIVASRQLSIEFHFKLNLPTTCARIGLKVEDIVHYILIKVSGEEPLHRY